MNTIELLTKYLNILEGKYGYVFSDGELTTLTNATAKFNKTDAITPGYTLTKGYDSFTLAALGE